MTDGKIDKILFYMNKDQNCNKVIDKIKQYNITGIRYIDVNNKNNVIPESINRIPALILVKEPDRIYLGAEIVNWIEFNNEYTKIESNNINKVKDEKEFKTSKTLNKLVHSIGTSFNGDDNDIYDAKADSIMLGKLGQHITDNINVKMKDKKINEKKQEEYINFLMKERNNDIINIMEKYKDF